MYKDDYDFIKDCLKNTFTGTQQLKITWYQNNDTLITVARILDNESCFESPAEVIRYFEKPWHFEDKMRELLESYASEFEKDTREFKELDSIDD